MKSISVQLAYPAAVAAPHRVAGERGKDVAIGENDVAGIEQRQDLALITIGEIGAADQRKGGWRQQLAFFSFSSRFADNGRRVPFREEDLVALELEPSFKQIHL